MTYPTDDLTNTHLDASTDDPSQARAELNALLLKVQAMIAATGVGANDALKLDSNADIPAGVDHAGDTGFGIQTPDTRIHAWKASAGTVVADSDAVITAENNTNCYIQTLAPNTSQCGILFGDVDQVDIGMIKYWHSSDQLRFYVNGSAYMRLDSNGQLNLSSNGTAAAPIYTTSGDLNTGMFKPSNGVVAFSMDATETIRFQNAGGISFNGDSAAANALDDYEEGTFTPVITDGSFNASAYSVQVGNYQKVGNTVHIKGYVRTSNLGSITGSVRISGMPFTADATASSHSSFHCSQGLGLAITAGEQVAGYISPAQTEISLRLWDDAAGTTSMGSAEWSANGGVFFAGHFQV